MSVEASRRESAIFGHSENIRLWSFTNEFQRIRCKIKQFAWGILGWLVLLFSNAQCADTSFPSDRSSLEPFRDCSDCPEMIMLPTGSFDMGLEKGLYNFNQEKPVHRVTITKPFALGKTEVTQGQWKAIMGNNPSQFPSCGDNCPVEKVDWDDAHEFIRKLNIKTGKQYRLPTEAEWEYACRAGGHYEYCGSDNVNDVAWYEGNSGKVTHPVATKQSNVWGLYDMSGNVSEWIEDFYHENYKGAPTDGSAWQEDHSIYGYELRGGDWTHYPPYLRAAVRGWSGSGHPSGNMGFRLARTNISVNTLNSAVNKPTEAVNKSSENKQTVSHNDGFPEIYISINPQTRAIIPWRRSHLVGGPWGNTPDPSLKLINEAEGSVVVYTAPGPELKPGTEIMKPFDLMTAQLQQKPIPPGQPGTNSGYFALLLKKNDGFKLLPLNYSESDPGHITATYPFNYLVSKFDGVHERYLLFTNRVSFTAASWDITIPSWQKFDAWWLDAKNETLEHIVLPAGPWVSDAKLDKVLLRDVRNFSCGTDCYRSYEIKVENGSIFVTILGRPSAINETVTGTYRLKEDGKGWEKIKN